MNSFFFTLPVFVASISIKNNDEVIQYAGYYSFTKAKDRAGLETLTLWFDIFELGSKISMSFYFENG